MSLTNVYGLPEAIVAAVQNDEYSRGRADFSVTELINPPQIVQLLRRHRDEIIQDVADMGFLLMGKIAHGILERANLLDSLSEERLYMDVNGVVISGQMDHFILTPEETLYDYKVTSVYATKDSRSKPEWEQQLNLYAELLRRHSFHPARLRIMPIYRDFRNAEKARNKWYPSHALGQPIEIPLWSQAAMDRWLPNRVLAHVQARDNTPDDGDLPHCTDAERWARPARWAVYKTNRAKRADKLCTTPEQAESECRQHERGRIEFRPAEYPRCQAYCAVARFCWQWKDIQDESHHHQAV